MSRAVLLPTSGDPYIVATWVKGYKRFCQHVVDKLYVCINSPHQAPVMNYLVELFNTIPGTTIVTHDNFIDHGPAITELLDLCNEDYIFIAEDDFYVQDSTKMEEWFSHVESGRAGLVGSMRGCAGDALIKATATRFGLVGDEARQPNFWPALLVVKTDDIRKTDKNFAGYIFEAGVHIPIINYTPDHKICGDTFVWASIQLRGLGLRCIQIPHNRWIDVIGAGISVPKWIHVGSSSCSMNGFLLNDDMKPIANPDRYGIRNLPAVPSDGVKGHYEALFSGWKVYNETFPIPEGPASYFNKLYADALQRNIVGCQLNPLNITKFTNMTRRFLGPTFS